ncbi:MAG: hypothetical protein WEB04_11830 [Dehalococcoidia bacterium]
MAAPARALLTELPKGHEFSTTTFSLTRDGVSRYLDAVEDANGVYLERGLAPPLAVAALALGSLLEVIELPAATLHIGQEVDVHAGVPLDTPLTLSGRIAQRSQRAGMIISIIEFDVTPEGSSSAALTGRSTVMVPPP